MFTTSWSRGPFVHSVQTTKSHDEDDAGALSRHLATVGLMVDQVGEPDQEAPVTLEAIAGMDPTPAPAATPAAPA